jgi:ATP-binding cassette, subfamily A (ABC1), member 3
VFDGSLALIWTDGANGNVTGPLNPAAVIAQITSGFSASQIASVRRVATPQDIPNACPQNFNLFSQCFAAISFNSFGQNNTMPLNYTISADAGLYHVDSISHTSDYELRILPLQWAVDKVSMS